MCFLHHEHIGTTLSSSSFFLFQQSLFFLVSFSLSLRPPSSLPFSGLLVSIAFLCLVSRPSKRGVKRLPGSTRFLQSILVPSAVQNSYLYCGDTHHKSRQGKTSFCGRVASTIKSTKIFRRLSSRANKTSVCCSLSASSRAR